MDLKPIAEYSDRELLELILSNQIRTEQRIFKMYSFLSQVHNLEFHKNNQSKLEALKNFLDSFDGLDKEIRSFIAEQED